MIDAALSAFGQLFSPPFRSVFWRSLAITIAALVAIWTGIQGILIHFVVFPWPWAETALAIISGLGLIIGMAFLVAPVSSLVAGIYLDEIADNVEETHYPDESPGDPVPFARSMVLSAKFAGLVLLVNIVALLLLLIPGVNLIAFFGANGYLLGREYFELAGLRHRPHKEVMDMRKRNRVRIFLAGLLIAGLLAIPILNLLTPLFATAFMVHMYKRVEAREERLEYA